MKGWAGWITGSEVESSKFQELVLCPSGDRTESTSEVNNFCAECGSILTLKGAGARKILAHAAQGNKKEYKVSGNMSLPSKMFWNKSKEVRIHIALPK